MPLKRALEWGSDINLGFELQMRSVGSSEVRAHKYANERRCRFKSGNTPTSTKRILPDTSLTIKGI